MAWFLSNIRYVAWTTLAVGALMLIYFAMGVRAWALATGCSGKACCAGCMCFPGSCGSACYYFNFVPDQHAENSEARAPAIGKISRRHCSGSLGRWRP